MTTLMSLPWEIIDTILSYNDISFEDIINFRCVCKAFQLAARTDEYFFLKKKFYQRWPSAKKYYDEQTKINSKQRKFKKNKQEDKKHLTFIEIGIDCVRKLHNFIPKVMIEYDHILKDNYMERLIELNELKETFMNLLLNEEDVEKVKYYILSERCYAWEGIKEEIRFKKVTKNYIKVLFFIDEMKHVLTQPPRVGYDLTEKYCYIKLFDYLKIYWRDNMVKGFEERPSKELLEISATVLAQQLHFEKDKVFYSSVKASLNTLALEALHFLREKHPKHSIFSTSKEYFSYWEENNIDDNFWSETEGIQIMDALEEYMFDELNFRPIESKDLKYMCIDYVLEKKCGNDLILFTIYESVARRLGLRCDIVTDPEFLLFWIRLFWNPTFNFPSVPSVYEYILRDYRDIMRCFDINSYKFPDCINKSIPEFHIEKKTFTEMLKSSLHTCCTWPKCCTDGNILDLLDYSTVYVYIKEYVPKPRPQEVKFAVGMIVKHGNESTDCSTGVIIGWYQHNYKHNYDEGSTCIIYNITKRVMPLKMCSNLAAGKRTYYIILTKSHNLCHVEEGDVSLTTPNWIENINIYRYFRKFEGTHYVPNQRLAEVYPHDTAITDETILKSLIAQITLSDI